MNEGKKPTGKNDVMSLVELQKFLADELTSTGMGSHFERAFVPLTDGLGLESPTEKIRKPAYVSEVETPPAKKPVARKLIVDAAFEAPVVAPTPTAPTNAGLRQAIEGPSDALLEKMRKVREQADEEMPPVDSLLRNNKPSVRQVNEPEKAPGKTTFAKPPQLPKPSGFRRLLAVILDEVFVGSLVVLAVIITAGVLARGEAGWTGRLGAEINNPMFMRFVVLEYLTIWLAYLAIGIGLLDTTFGMWVWGLKVSYGKDAPSGIQKWLRIVMSFLFLAPVAPLVLLMFRSKGKNLIDKLTGSHLYVSN